MPTSNMLMTGEDTDIGCARYSRDASERSSITMNSFGAGASYFNGLRGTQNDELIRNVSDKVRKQAGHPMPVSKSKAPLFYNPFAAYL